VTEDSVSIFQVQIRRGHRNGRRAMNIPVHELVESPVSGSYVRRAISRFQGGTPEVVEAVRLDVDGSLPQMIASGWFMSSYRKGMVLCHNVSGCDDRGRG
jgi:hypothetical protein